MQEMPQGAQQPTPLLSPEVCAQGMPPYVGCMGTPAVVGPVTVGVLIGRVGPQPSGCQAFPSTDAGGPLVACSKSWHSWLCGPGGS